MIDIVERLKDADAATHALFDYIFQDALKEIERLRSKVEAMEQQEPVASVWRCDNGHIHGSCERTLPMGTKLYLAPGAQPAPSVLDGWKLVPIEPTEDMLRAMTDPFIAINGDNRKAFEIAYTAMLAVTEAKP